MPGIDQEQPDDDALLTYDEAGAILGVTKMTMYRMVVDGIIARGDDTRWKNRQVIGSSVERLAQDWSRRLSIPAAAGMLDVGVDKVRDLIRHGLLPRHRYGPGPIAIDDVQHLIDTGALQDPVHEGRVPLAVAAETLGFDRAHRLVRQGRIPGMKDSRGTGGYAPNTSSSTFRRELLSSCTTRTAVRRRNGEGAAAVNPESHPVSGRSGDVFGEPVMTANPLITRAQAAAILGVPRQRVYQMVLAGILRAEDGHKDRRYRLRDVEALTVPITTHEAAAILACDIDAVLELIRTGALARTGDALRPVRRGEVEWRATLRQPFLVRHNTVDVRTAAAILGIPEDDVRDLAQQDLLPVRRTRNRGYRFRREHLELIANAWRAAEEHNRSPRS